MMYFSFFILFYSFGILEGKHFNGGTITWAPINPYSNSSPVDITITQSYAWAYPTITCANNVPITTSGRSGQNWNLTCVVDCTTDGGYSTKPIDVLTDCKSVSTSLGMMSSARSHNLSLIANSHFYLANVGSAWVSLNYPAQNNLQWSIVSFIDLRMRPDGFINTPPVASVVSPQYATLTKTIQINIPVSDANAGDDVRCRWSTYTPGYRRRRSNNGQRIQYQSIDQFDEESAKYKEVIHIRKKRAGCPWSSCHGTCSSGCPCTCTDCDNALCPGVNCNLTSGCESSTVNTTTTSTTRITTTTTASTTTIETTTIETQGTLVSTSSYPHRQAIDECGGICYPGSLPNGTTLANCTITFTGLRAGTWYAVAVQVEDFINSTSTTALSSVPVQFLIYVLPQPACSKLPIILPLDRCLEVQVGVSISFSLYAMNLCNKTISTITDILVSSGINGMTASNLTASSTNSSLSYVTYTWTPQANQLGLEELCTVAYTSEKAQSDQYCVTFTVKNSSDVCVTTTTTSTTTTTESTTSTSETTTTTSSTTTSESTTTTSETTSTTSTSTSTTSTTSSTSSSSSSTSSTSSTSTTSTSTSSTSTSTTTTSTSVTTTTSISTTATTVTTTTVTTATTTTTKTPEKSTNWLLILGLSLLGLLLALCCACCCLYHLLWGPAARRRRQRRKEGVDTGPHTFISRSITGLSRKTRAISRIYQTKILNKENRFDNMPYTKEVLTSSSPSDLRISVSESTSTRARVEEEEEKHISSAVSVKKIRRSDITSAKSLKNLEENEEDIHAKSPNYHNSNENLSTIQSPLVTVLRMNKSANLDETNKRISSVIQGKPVSATSTIPSKPVLVNVIKAPRSKTSMNTRPRASSVGDVSMIQLDKSSIELRSIRNRSKSSKRTTDGKSSTGNGVKVTKIPRKPTATQSHHS